MRDWKKSTKRPESPAQPGEPLAISHCFTEAFTQAKFYRGDAMGGGIGVRPTETSAQFQSEFRGIAEYYQLAFNRHQLGHLKYAMEQSLTKTLARKFRISVSQVYRRYRAILRTEQGPRKGLQVKIERSEGRKPLVAQWGGISLARRTMAVELNDSPPSIWNSQRSELIQRLLADTCERCESHDNVEVHHIRPLERPQTQRKQGQPEWVKNMAARRRKTLIVCRRCHEDIHAGRW